HRVLVVMPNFSKKCLVFEVFLQPQRRVQRQFLSCGFVGYFCAAKRQSGDLKTVQRAQCASCYTLLGNCTSEHFQHMPCYIKNNSTNKKIKLPIFIPSCNCSRFGNLLFNCQLYCGYICRIITRNWVCTIFCL